MKSNGGICSGLAWVLLMLSVTGATVAATLPEERADAMYHFYDGGGIQVTGPALLVRKNFSDKHSLSVDYYTDNISGASIDVVSNASAYTENRDQYRFGLQYMINDDTSVSLSYSFSDENDYEAATIDVGIEHEFFGGMSTIAAGVSVGDDTVMRVDNNFRDTIDRIQYRASLTQVLTPTFVAAFSYEGVDEDGYLNNPYRSALLLGATLPERYPRTRTSNAFGINTNKYWKNGKFVSRLNYRFYEDDWAVEANNIEFALAKKFGENLELEAGVRYYTQDGAFFYNDNFQEEFLYMGRDKELSNFTSFSIGGRVAYQVFASNTSTIRKGMLSIRFDRISFDYDDFTDLQTGKLYEFDANVMQMTFSALF